MPNKNVVIAADAIPTVIWDSMFTVVKHGVMKAAVAVSLLKSKQNLANSLNVPVGRCFMLYSSSG